MARTEILVLMLEPEHRIRSLVPDKSVFFDAKAANSLGVSLDIEAHGPLSLFVGRKQGQMLGVIFSQETPSGHIVRMTRKALNSFQLKNGHRYWMEWNASTKELRVFG